MLAAVAAGLVGLSIVLAFFVAPEDADQGISQRIFYFHVPIALTAYACFGWGAYKALLLLWKREERYDLESYVAIHQGTIFGALTLATGSIWAKASWGHWWVWDSNQLVLFLVLFLFYSAYFMLRFSIEEGPRRANVSAVYALFGVALIPVSFLAIRLAEDFIHPTTFTRDGPQMTGTMFFTFCVSWLAITALAYALYRVELLGKRLDANLRELREALSVSSRREVRRGCLRRRLRDGARLRRDHRGEALAARARDRRAGRARSAASRWLSSSSSLPCSHTAKLRSPTPASSAGPASPAGSQPGACGSAGSPRPRCSSGRRRRRRDSRGEPGPARSTSSSGS